MTIRAKLIGFVLIVIGVLPFLLKLGVVSDFFDSYSFLTFIMPGEIGYQVLIIVLGVFLIWTVKSKFEMH